MVSPSNNGPEGQIEYHVQIRQNRRPSHLSNMRYPASSSSIVPVPHIITHMFRNFCPCLFQLHMPCALSPQCLYRLPMHLRSKFRSCLLSRPLFPPSIVARTRCHLC